MAEKCLDHEADMMPGVAVATMEGQGVQVKKVCGVCLGNLRQSGWTVEMRPEDGQTQAALTAEKYD